MTQSAWPDSDVETTEAGPDDVRSGDVERRVLINPTAEDIQRLQEEFGELGIPTEWTTQLRPHERDAWISAMEPNSDRAGDFMRLVSVLRAAVVLGFTSVGAIVGYLDSSIGPTWGVLAGLIIGLIGSQMTVTREVKISSCGRVSRPAHSAER